MTDKGLISIILLIYAAVFIFYSRIAGWKYALKESMLLLATVTGLFGILIVCMILLKMVGVGIGG